MTDITHEAAKQFATLRDLIADTAADLSNSKPYWTAGCLADALIRTGQIIHAVPSGDEVEAVARAMALSRLKRQLPDIADHMTANIVPASIDYEDATAAIARLDAHRGKQ